MGMGVPDINIIVKLRDLGFFAGERSVVEIGAQQMSGGLFTNQDWVTDCARAFGVGTRQFSGPSGGRIAHGDKEALDAHAPSTRELWQWLGFSYASVDVDGSPGAIPLDLNFAETPLDMIGKASLVTNCGTTEHIANQVNAFKVIHELTAVGGVMMHNLPAQGYLVHGLINYNPKFFWALSAANGYKWMFADFSQSSVTYPLSPDIIGELAVFDKAAAERVKNYRFADCGLVAVMQKLYDLPFIPPIDVPTGSKTDIEELKQRYWTIFDRDRFHALIEDLERAKSAKRK